MTTRQEALAQTAQMVEQVEQVVALAETTGAVRVVPPRVAPAVHRVLQARQVRAVAQVHHQAVVPQAHRAVQAAVRVAHQVAVRQVQAVLLHRVAAHQVVAVPQALQAPVQAVAAQVVQAAVQVHRVPVLQAVRAAPAEITQTTGLMYREATLQTTLMAK